MSWMKDGSELAIWTDMYRRKGGNGGSRVEGHSYK